MIDNLRLLLVNMHMAEMEISDDLLHHPTRALRRFCGHNLLIDPFICLLITAYTLNVYCYYNDAKH